MLTANEDLACDHVCRHVEDARIQQLAAHPIEGGEPLSSGERLISRQRRSNLLQQAAERGLVFDVKSSPPVALEDFLNIVANQVFGLAFQP